MDGRMQRRLSLAAAALAAASLIAGTAAAAVLAGPDPAEGRSLSGSININTATVPELMVLPRIGPSKAKAIVDYRTKHAFKTIAEIIRVRGIGPKTFRELKGHLSVSGPTTLERVKTDMKPMLR
jgi:competence protein ComEA